MKKTLKRTLTGICASLVLLTASTCASSDIEKMEYVIGMNVFDTDSCESLSGFCGKLFVDNGVDTALYHGVIMPAWMRAYATDDMYPEDGCNYPPLGPNDITALEAIIIPIPYNTTVIELCNILDSSESIYTGGVLSEAFEFLNLTENDLLRTGSIIRYKGADADKYPYDIKVIVYGDVIGGEEGLGDGKVDILDVVKMRNIIVNGKSEDLKTNQYLVYKAFKCGEFEDDCNISDVVRVRSMIVNAK